MAASEVQREPMNHLGRQGMSVANLAQRTGYSPLLLPKNLIVSKVVGYPWTFSYG
jgi:hypothetical protein